MKSLFLLIFIIFCFTANATTYYISANGNDANNGSSASSSWKTLSKLNSFFSSLQPGDNVLLNRGDVFYGSITINKSGTSASPITIGAYGTGAQPVITGFTTVNAWTSLGSNIWESTSAVSTLPGLNMVTIGGVNTAMGRIPNTGYYTYQSGNTATITSSSLNSTDWTGASAVIRKSYSTTNVCSITSQSGTTLSFTDPVQSTSPATAGFGFFIQNDVRTLDAQNEWYYNPSTKKIRIFSAATPANVQVATVANAVSDNGFDYVTFDGISITGANNDGILCSGTTDKVVVKNCSIDFSGTMGFENSGGTSDSVYNSTINHSGKAGMFILSTSPYIGNNNIFNSGVVDGQSDWNIRNSAIYCTSNNATIIYNVIRGTGSNGIVANGPSYVVRYNLIDSSVLLNNDNGAIYCNNSSGVKRIIDHNIVLNVIGNGMGTNTPASHRAEGIYLDENCNHVSITNNTVANSNSDGLKYHISFNNRADSNTFYNNMENQLRIQGGSETVADSFRYNIFFSKAFSVGTKQQWGSNITNSAGNFSGMGTFDYNYYARPISETNTITTQVSGSTDRTLAGWQSVSGQDAHSNKSPKTITDVTDLRFEYNATTSSKTISLDGNYIDVRNVSYNGTITLAPYTSAVLIRNGAATNQPPTANAGADQAITLPTNTVSLAGSGTDTDGTITAYSWTKISGPSAGTITSASSASTTVTGLTQGVYQYQLKVTDNSTATAFDTVQITVAAAANIAPTANAGADQAITLPTNTVSLAGSGTDTDGTITAYSWTKISGPSASTITSASSASTTVTGLTQGVYQYQLKVTDNSTATAFDTVQITVTAAANIAPTANAGADQAITLPTNTVSLTGSGADTDGTISAYNWTKISGPSAGAITSAGSASTTVTGLTQGVYQYQLKVTDNSAATAFDTVQITVAAAANIAPTANAGADQAITLPTNTVSLTGSGADTDGTISAYSWTKISGPSAGAITSAGSASTTVTGLTQGVYQYQLKVTDNSAATAFDTVQITVAAAANIAPTANAGADQAITLPTNTVSLTGNGADTDGTIASYAWTRISGPSAGTITNAGAASTSVTGLTQGVYQYQLKVTDNNAATAFDTVQITVAAAANIAPTANAGADQAITLPTNTVSLTGSGTDTDGTIAAYNWTKISGPSAGSITSVSSASTTVTGLTQGVYQYQLKVTDNSAATAFDTVQITVTAAANIAPTANAGADQAITLPTNTISLTGSGADTDGTIAAYSWTKISGPSAGTITNASAASTSVTGLIQGVYQYQLKVTDNNAATAFDTVQITVTAAANIAPTANAGADQAITLPTNTVSLTGSGTDTDGTIAAYNWTKISGPSAGSITSASSASTTVTGLTQGVYQYQLKVTDNSAATAFDTVQITVTAAANIAPTANAGADQAITLPTNTVSLTGSGADTDGTIAAYSWTKISGPSAGSITSAGSASTTVTGLTQGVYQYQLKVTDNSAATAFDTVQITVTAAANIPPTANAGADQAITLPTNTVSLTGSGTDTDGTIAAYSWTKISGPSAGSITSASSASTTVTGLTQGVYQYQLKVTDNSAATAFDTVQITVTAAANIPPTAIAGSDQSITLPVNTASLAGNGTDQDGTVSIYNWRKISGPSSYNIVDASSPVTDVSGLVQGVYKFELKVTDNNGASALDTVQVTVNAAINIPPVAEAGANQDIDFPINKTNIAGSGTDADGTVKSYRWTKISGPSVTIVSPNSKSTSITGLSVGDYKFQLMVTDNSGATGKDSMEVSVTLGTLPLNLLVFKGQLLNDQVNLTWKTANEKNASGFDIEKLAGSTWVKVGFMAAAGSSSSENNYSFIDNLAATGFNFYRLKMLDLDGKYVYSDIINVELKARRNVVYQNVPNPFRSVTTIQFELADKAPVKIIVFNTIGTQVAVLVNETRQPGTYNVQWNAANFPAGNYFYKVIIGDYVSTKQMMKIN